MEKRLFLIGLSGLILLACSTDAHRAQEAETAARMHYEKALEAWKESSYLEAEKQIQAAKRDFSQFEDDTLQARILATEQQIKNDTAYSAYWARMFLSAQKPAKDIGPEYVLHFFQAMHLMRAKDWERADSCFRLAEQAEDCPRSSREMFLRNHARMLMQKTPPEPKRALDLYRWRQSIVPEYGCPTDLEFAEALYATGQKDSAQKVMQRIREVDKNRSSELDAEMGRSALERGKQKIIQLQQQRKKLWTLLGAFLVLSLLGTSLFLRQKARREAEIARLSAIASQTKVLLKESERKNETYRSQLIRQYKAQFTTLQQLAEEALTARHRTDPEKYLARKANELARLVSNDEKGWKDFEARLDRDLDGIMTHLREDYPGRQEKTYRLIGYLIAGFDATAISLLLDYSVDSVYVRKSRILQDLKALDTPRKKQYLEMIQ